MKIINWVLAATAATCALAVPAGAQVANSQCGFPEDAPIFGVGVSAGTAATPILQPLEKQIVAKGDRSETLRSVAVPATAVSQWTSDYAMMRLSQVAGRPIWAMTESGQPGEVVSLNIPATNLADAFDRVAAAKGKRWRYDGEKVYLLGGREWTIPMPQNRDLALAVEDALTKNRVKAAIVGSVIKFEADNAGVERIRGVVNQVYAQKRLNPYDVRFFKVYPTRGYVDWSALVERTDAIESVTFNGKGATLVMDPTAGAVIDAFLAREGQVQQLGGVTMVSGQSGISVSRSAGCGAAATGARGLELTGGSFERGKMGLRYTVLGSDKDQSGQLAVAPGAVVVIADGVPDQGAYMVAVIRPRVLELQPTVAPGFSTPAVVPVATTIGGDNLSG